MNKIIENNFGIADYTILFVMLGISSCIGLFFGCRKKSQTTDEYLLGNKKMKVIPIGISLIASQISSITILVQPSEIYAYGPNMFFLMIPMIFVIMLVNWIFLPVFYNNKIDNCYKYLEARFGKEVKWLVTIIYLITNFLLMPIYSFLPALALSQVIDCSPHIINIICCSVCVFYTLLGGIKAVVWTDVVQASVMVTTVIIIISMSIFKVEGGLYEIWKRNLDGKRLDINVSLDFTNRHSIWNLLFGSTIFWSAYICFNQNCLQRIASVPSMQHARRTIMIFAIGAGVITAATSFMGFVMYAYFYKCDPMEANLLQSIDKMIPFFVQQITGHLYGMSGLFSACLFSASLSTISANLHSMAGIIYYDIIKPIKYLKNTERNANIIMKIIIIIIGIYAVLLGLVVATFSSLYEMIFTFFGITQCIIFGVFTLGMLYPCANKKSVIIAAILASATLTWLFCGTQILVGRGDIVYPKLPTVTTGCSDFNITTTTTTTTNVIASNYTINNTNDDFSIYKISFQWYAIIGTILMWLIGIPLSHLIGREDIKTLNPNLISSIAKWLIPKYIQQIELHPVKKNTNEIATDEECEHLNK